MIFSQEINGRCTNSTEGSGHWLTQATIYLTVCIWRPPYILSPPLDTRFGHLFSSK